MNNGVLLLAYCVLLLMGIALIIYVILSIVTGLVHG